MMRVFKISIISLTAFLSFFIIFSTFRKESFRHEVALSSLDAGEKVFPIQAEEDHLINNVCLSQKHIVFVKTEKTGSSTMKKLISRIAGRNAIKVLGIMDGKPSGFPAPFNASLAFYQQTSTDKIVIYNSGEEKPTLLNGHFVFNKDEVAKLMPSDSTYLTIIRDPITLSASAFNYFYRSRRFVSRHHHILMCILSPYVELFDLDRNKTFQDFLEVPIQRITASVPMYFRARNLQAYDLGWDVFNNDAGYIKSKLKEMESTFHLVVILEYFKESLILLKEMLCLRWEDILYEAKNVREYEKPNYTRSQIDKLRDLYNQDFIIYEHFNKTLWKKIDFFGRNRMEKELEIFNKKLKVQNGYVFIKTDNKKSKLGGLPYVYRKEDAHLFETGDEITDVINRLMVQRKTKYNLPSKFVESYAQHIANHLTMCEMAPA